METFSSSSLFFDFDIDIHMYMDMGVNRLAEAEELLSSKNASMPNRSVFINQSN